MTMFNHTREDSPRTPCDECAPPGFVDFSSAVRKRLEPFGVEVRFEIDKSPRGDEFVTVFAGLSEPRSNQRRTLPVCALMPTGMATEIASLIASMCKSIIGDMQDDIAGTDKAKSTGTYAYGFWKAPKSTKTVMQMPRNAGKTGIMDAITESRRLAIARMSRPLVEKAGICDGWVAPDGIDGIPSGAVVVGISEHLYFDSDDVAVKFRSEHFAPVPMGEAIPDITRETLPSIWVSLRPTRNATTGKDLDDCHPLIVNGE